MYFKNKQKIVNKKLIMQKFLKKKFTFNILSKLSFTPNFYKAVENRLLKNGKYLYLDILPGEGCGGFTYEFKSTSEKLNSEDNL